MRLIIEFDEKGTSSEALASVATVIGGGLVSGDGKSFCYLTRFANGLRVSSRPNRKSYKFSVRKWDDSDVVE